MLYLSNKKKYKRNFKIKKKNRVKLTWSFFFQIRKDVYFSSSSSCVWKTKAALHNLVTLVSSYVTVALISWHTSLSNSMVISQLPSESTISSLLSFIFLSSLSHQTKNKQKLRHSFHYFLCPSEDILEQLRNGTAKFELVSSPVPSVATPPNNITSLFGIGNRSALFFARIGSSL